MALYYILSIKKTHSDKLCGKKIAEFHVVAVGAAKDALARAFVVLRLPFASVVRDRKEKPARVRALLGFRSSQETSHD